MEQHIQPGGILGDVKMRAAFETLTAMIEGDAPLEERQAFLRSQFPGGENDRRDRFLCKTCRSDDGLVRVWSPRAIKACLEGKLDERKNRTTAMMTCHCEKGRVRVGEVVKGKPRPLFTRCFDASLDCLCRDPDSESSIADLKLWCDERLNAKPANYENAFDEWSN